MNSSRDLYDFSGDTAVDGTINGHKAYNATSNLEAKLAAEALNQDNRRALDKTPSITPNRHQHETDLSHNGRPIIVEYNNIFINSPSRKSPTLGESAEQSEPQSQQENRDLSPVNIQRDYNNLPYKTDQIYRNLPADIKYGAQTPSISGFYNNSHRAQEQCNPDYANRSRFPGYTPYLEQPSYPVQPNLSTFQNYPVLPNYPVYPSFPNTPYNYCPSPYRPSNNGGKLDQIARALREMGPLAFEITELSTGRRDFHHYPSVYGYRSNFFGYHNDFANTVPIYPFGVPLSSY